MILLLILFPLLLLVVHDFKHRYVYIWQLALFGLLQFGSCFWYLGLPATLCNTLFNLSALLVIGLFLCLYLFFRYRGRRQKAIGTGDLLFLPLLSPYFDSRAFLLFLIGSLIITLLGWIIYCRYRNDELNKVPLITGVGGCYLVILLFDLICLH